MVKPLVSIVIPFYNLGIFLKETVLSVLDQSYQNFEIIIINDGSTEEESISVLSQIKDLDARIKVYDQQNQGPCSAKNYGVEKASGTIVGFLDSDNCFLPEYIEKSVFAIENDGVDWFFGDLIYFGEKSGGKSQILKCREEIFINSPIDNCFFVRRSVFNEIRGFDEYLNRLGLEDWELIIRLITKRKSYKNISEPMFKYRVRSNSRSANEAKEFQKKIKRYVYEKHSEAFIDYYSNLVFENLKLKDSFEFKVGRVLRRILQIK